MLPCEEKVLIDIYRDKELDVFGVFKKRRLVKEKKDKSKIIMLAEERARKHNLLFYKAMTQKLVDIYSKEGAIRYLKVLYKPTLSTEKSVEGRKWIKKQFWK